MPLPYLKTFIAIDETPRCRSCKSQTSGNKNALLGVGPAVFSPARRELVDPAGEHLAARVPHGPYRAREAFPVLQVVTGRAPLLLVGVLRPAMPPFQELIAADLVILPPVAERDAAGVAELRYGVGRAAAEPGERLDGLLSLLCAVHSHGPPGPLLVQDFHRSPICIVEAHGGAIDTAFHVSIANRK